MLKLDVIREATRLTRSGQLAEATQLLQRMLRGDAAAGQASKSGERAASLHDAPTIELTARRLGETPQRQQHSPPKDAAPTRSGSKSLLDDMKALSGLVARGPVHRAPPKPSDIAPSQGRFVEAGAGDDAMRRRYKLYVPGGSAGKARPLIVMLHGCTQSADDFAAGTRMNFLAEEHGCLVAWPEQAREANASRCWNWFRPGDQRRGEGEPALVTAIIDDIMRTHAVDPRRVYAAGLSAGGAAAAVLADAYPDLFAAVGIHSGLACGAASDLPSALLAMRRGSAMPAASRSGGPVPTIVFHGDRDGTVHPSNGHDIIAQAGASDPARRKVVRGTVPGGRSYSRTLLADAGGRIVSEHWSIHGAGHAWSGGSPAGSFTDPQGPDATREMLRFFLEHRRAS